MENLSLKHNYILSEDLISVFLNTSSSLILINSKSEVIYSNDASHVKLPVLKNKKFFYNILTKKSYNMLKGIIDNYLLNNISLREIQLITKDNKTILVNISHLPSIQYQNYFIISTVDITEYKIIDHFFTNKEKLYTLGKLSSGLIHDWCNLLTVMIGYSDILLKKAKDNKDLSIGTVTTEISEIRANLDRANSLANQLLSFINNNQEIKHLDINIKEFFNNITNLIQFLLSGTVSLKIQIEDNLSYINIDKSKLEQVIINLIINARDAMQNSNQRNLNITVKGISINNLNFLMNDNSISIKQTKLYKGNYIVISISDTGVGIEKHNIEQIFDPFFSTKPKSTGIGLDTILRIMQENSGHIQIESQENIGTTFHVFFKTKNQKITNYNLNYNTNLNNKNDKKLKILIIEDEVSLRDFNKLVLLQNGYDVITTDKFDEMTDIIKSQGESIFLAIIDLIIHDISGIDIIKYIQKHASHIKCILTSGYNINNQLEELNNCDFLQKPYSKEEMLSLINSKINKN